MYGRGKAVHFSCWLLGVCFIHSAVHGESFPSSPPDSATSTKPLAVKLGFIESVYVSKPSVTVMDVESYYDEKIKYVARIELPPGVRFHNRPILVSDGVNARGIVPQIRRLPSGHTRIQWGGQLPAKGKIHCRWRIISEGNHKDELGEITARVVRLKEKEGIGRDHPDMVSYQKANLSIVQTSDGMKKTTPKKWLKKILDKSVAQNIQPINRTMSIP